MNEIRPGEIYLVEFDPSIGHEIQKTRPALVIGNKSLLTHSTLVPIVPLSSRASSKKKYEIVVPKNSENNLFSDSLILANQLYTYDRKRFVKKIGRVSEKVYLQTLEYLKLFLGMK